MTEIQNNLLTVNSYNNIRNNQEAQNLNPNQSSEEEKASSLRKSDDIYNGISLSIDDVFEMDEDQIFIFAFTNNEIKNKLQHEPKHCISPLLTSKKELVSINFVKEEKADSKLKVITINLPENLEETKIEPSKLVNLFQKEKGLTTIQETIAPTEGSPIKLENQNNEKINKNKYEDKTNNYFYSKSDINSMAMKGETRKSAQKGSRTESNMSYFAANNSNVNQDRAAAAKLRYSEFYEFPSVGVGIVLIHKDKILLGRRIDSGMYGLPGGWLEPGEEWEECAARELKEETGITMQSSSFKHIYTLNSINKEKNFHSVSCVMFGHLDENELKNLVNKEPNKCYGWFWISLSDLRNMYSLLFHPLREFLFKNAKIRKASEFKSLSKEKIDLDLLFENEDFMF